MSEAVLRFVVISDGHWGNEPEGTEKSYQELHDEMLDRLEAVHSDRPIDFLVHNGDIVHDDEDLHQEVIDNFFSELPREIDYYVVYGNHDWSTEGEWRDAYSQPKQHSFEYGDYGFIITNTARERSDEYACADSEWLGKQIDKFSDKNGVYVFSHIAPFTDTDYVGVDCPDVRYQLARDEVVATFLGHNHEKNIVEENDGGTYAYTCRFGGYEPDKSEYEIEELGLRVLDIDGETE